MLWYFVVFLDFFFNIVKLGDQKFTVSHNFHVWSFCLFVCLFFFFFFLMYNFKTNNNFSPKICYENIVDVKNKIIISNWDLPQLKIKNIAKMLWHFVVFQGFFFVWHFVVFLAFFFCLVKLGKPKFIVLGIIFFNWLSVCFLFFVFVFFKCMVKSV